MSLRDRVERFAAGLHGLIGAKLSQTLGAAGAHLIISPGAGAFSRAKRLRGKEDELAGLGWNGSQSAGSPGRLRLYLAEYPGHPAALVEAIARADKAAPAGDGRELIISAGGDGTHREVLTALLGLPDGLRRRFDVLRLPFGTGNDGADADNLEAALKILSGGAGRAEVEALLISPAGRAPFYAFNVASLGIDAFVTGLTNRLKGVLPGDSYRIIADASVLFYDLLYGTGKMVISCAGRSGAEERREGRFILAVFGVSGRRSYGDHKRILPDDSNVCAITNRSLLGKLRIKPLLYRGEHLGQPGVVSLSSRLIQVDYAGRIPLQTDGEATKLEKEDFPCRFEVLETGIQALKLRPPA